MEIIGKSQLGEQVYERIAKALLNGQMRPNDKLTIRALAEQLGVSSTPVRDAIKQLVLEKVLEQRSSKDVRVPVMSETKYLEILDIRLSLEGLAAERAATAASPDQITYLHRLLEQNDKAIAQLDWDKAATHNQEFHLALSAASGMPVLQGLLRGLWLQMGPLVACYYDTAPDGLNHHHRIVVEAIEAGDGAAARAAIEADLLAAKDDMLHQVHLLRTRLEAA